MPTESEKEGKDHFSVSIQLIKDLFYPFYKTVNL